MSWQELIENGAIAQAILGTGLIIGILWQVIHSIPIDPILAGFFGTVLGYFFRVTTTIAQRRTECDDQ